MLRIDENRDLSDVTSLRLPGKAAYFCQVSSDEELRQALGFAKESRLTLTVLGGGSNTVINNNINGLVVRVTTSGVEVVSENTDSIVISVAAGENWHQLVKTCLRKQWYGLENLGLIPGLVGAAPIQNIGAYGVELASVLEAVDVLDIHSGELRTLAAEQCQLSYRDSIFKHELRGKVIITRVLLRLARKPTVDTRYPALKDALAGVLKPSPQDVFEAVCAIRTAKLPDPAKIPNAGSFFKNPVLPREQAERLIADHPGIPYYLQEDPKAQGQSRGGVKFPAAWFIDQAGWKGFREGAVGVHPAQALVLVNYGGATSAELLGLADRISADIKQKFGVAFEMEPVVVGVNNP